MKLDDKALREALAKALWQHHGPESTLVALERGEEFVTGSWVSVALAFGQAVRDAAYAEAAEVCDRRTSGADDHGWELAAEECAREIRNLIPNKQE
jgi:hypothetical protein